MKSWVEVIKGVGGVELGKGARELAACPVVRGRGWPAPTRATTGTGRDVTRKRSRIGVEIGN